MVFGNAFFPLVGIARLGYLGRDAVSLEHYDVDIIDAVLEHVYAETAAGRPIVSKADGRVVIRK